MLPIAIKYLVTATLVVLVSEFAKRSDKLGALIGALPLVTTIAMIWMAVELKGDVRIEKISQHAWFTFWYVLPTLPMFLVMPVLLRKGVSFGWALGIYCGGTVVLFVLLHLILKKFGAPLM